MSWHKRGVKAYCHKEVSLKDASLCLFFSQLQLENLMLLFCLYQKIFQVVLQAAKERWFLPLFKTF